MRVTKQTIYTAFWRLGFGVAILFFIKLISQVFIIAKFNVPSDSMYPAILSGQKVYVNKLAYGPRIFDYTKTIHHGEIFRLPGFFRPKRNDIVVFNDPYTKCADSLTFDVMRYMVKRCIATAGDTIEIIDGYYKVRGYNEPLGYVNSQRYLANLTKDEILISTHNIKMEAFPYSEKLGWNIKDFGPLYIPRASDTVILDSTNIVLYKNIIEWETGTDTISGTYTFKENYYFVAGDNCYLSHDSRYFGLIPEEFIVGRVDYITD